MFDMFIREVWKPFCALPTIGQVALVVFIVLSIQSLFSGGGDFTCYGSRC